MFAFIPETHQWHLGRKMEAAQEAASGVGQGPDTSAVKAPVVGEEEVKSDNVIDVESISESSQFEVTPNTLTEKEMSEDEADEIISAPTFVPPWVILGLLFDRELFVTFVMNAFAFATMFTSLTVLPVYLANEPYNLSPGLVGVTYLPVGVTMMLGAVVGGRLSDYSAAKFNMAKEGRMLYPVIISSAITIGSIGFGLTLFYGVNLAGPLLTQALLGFCQAVLMPTTNAYLTAKMPDKSGAASACFFFLCFAFAAISVSFSLIISNAIGVQYFFIILGLVCLVLIVLGFVQYVFAVKRGYERSLSKRSSSQQNVNL